MDVMKCGLDYSAGWEEHCLIFILISCVVCGLVCYVGYISSRAPHRVCIRIILSGSDYSGLTWHSTFKTQNALHGQEGVYSFFVLNVFILQYVTVRGSTFLLRVNGFCVQITDTWPTVLPKYFQCFTHLFYLNSWLVLHTLSFLLCTLELIRIQTNCH